MINTNFFRIGHLTIEYHRGDYNSARTNERSIEVPIGQWFIKKMNSGFNHGVVEVGAVLCHYGCNDHPIIDLTEKGDKIINANALDYDYIDKNVVSLSTIEHMMKREYNNGSDKDSIDFLNKVIREASNFLISFPVDYNEFLDVYVKDSNIPRVLMKRMNYLNEWEQEFDINKFNYFFGHRNGRFPDGRFNNANACVFVTNQKELLAS